MARSAMRQLALPAWSKLLKLRPSVSITILLGGPACAACPACTAASCDRPNTPSPANSNPIAIVDPRYMVLSLLDFAGFECPQHGFCADGHWVATSSGNTPRAPGFTRSPLGTA